MEEQRLIEKLSERGVEYIEEFVKKEMLKPSIREKIEKLRKRLQEQAKKIKEKKEKEYQKRRMEVKKRFEKEFEVIKKERKRIVASYKEEEKRHLSEIEKVILEDELLKFVVELPSEEKVKEGLLEKIKKFFLALLAFFKWLVSGFRKKKEKRRRESKLLISAPWGSLLPEEFDLKLKNVLFRNKDFRKSVEKEMKKMGVSPFLTKFDKKKYLKEVEKVVKKRIEDRVKEKEKEFEKEKAQMEREIKETLKKEEKRKEEMKRSLSEIEEDYKKEAERLEKALDEIPEKMLKKGVVEDLKKLGYLREDKEGLTITSQLIERFASILLSAELQAIPAGSNILFGRSEKREGVYEKGRMVSVDESSRMDMVDTIIQARLTHPWERHIRDEDVVVKRELAESWSHVVIALDTSYSMLENRRMEAAKRAVLALYKAVERENPKNIIDIIGFNTHVGVLDLLDVWEAEPKGFTNTSGALRTANHLFKDSKAETKHLYLITDGLPEAYTDEKGNDVVADPETSLPYAFKEAKKLEANLTLILLEPEDPLYVKAAEKIVKASPHGKMLITDPKKLARDILEDFILV